MSYDYNNVTKGMAGALANVVGLRTHATVPSKVSPPCAIVAIGSDAADDFAGSVTVEIKVLLLVSQADRANAQTKLNEYRSTSTNRSVIHAVEHSRTLPYTGGDTVNSVVWVSTDEPSKFEVGGIDYLGVEMTFEALVGA